MADIAIINRSTVAVEWVLAQMVPALQAQIDHDFYPFWGTRATLHFVNKDCQPDPAHWQCWIMDHSDKDGDLGYHVDPNGVPTAKVFAAEDANYGSLLSVTISHELLEMLADPSADRTFQLGEATYIVEVADPVEADNDGYNIDGIRVSNFATPRYFGMQNPAQDPRYDLRGLLKAGIPTLRPGGYCMFNSGGVWHSTMARHLDGTLGHRATRIHGRSRFRSTGA